MLLSFPHMGQLYRAISEACRSLDIACVIPPLPGPQALNLGQELAPEGSCLPFCLVLGNMRQGLEMGADTLLMLGGAGPCRFGYFVYLAERILREAGYTFQMVIIDRGYNYRSLTTIKKAGSCSWGRFLQALRRGWLMMSMEEELARLEREYLPRVVESHSLQHLLKECRLELQQITSISKTGKVRHKAWSAVNKMTLKPRDEVLSVGLVGDIYTMLEPYANYRVEEILLEREVCVYKDMAVSTWFPNVLLPWRRGPYRENLLGQAYPYLNDAVGGFGLESVAHARKMAREDVDGIIQMFPLGCMPEIVARSALNRIGREENFPVLSITMDQHDSETGFLTRLEAFLEILRMRKKRETA